MTLILYIAVRLLRMKVKLLSDYKSIVWMAEKLVEKLPNERYALQIKWFICTKETPPMFDTSYSDTTAVVYLCSGTH